MIPARYAYITQPNAPRILREAVKLYGTKELAGDANNPKILAWADEIGGWIGDWYDKDSIPWCGLFVAVCAKRAGYPFTQKALSALEWVKWGTQVANPMLGDVLIFRRKGGGHVGFYVGEDKQAFHVLGSNQNDEVNIVRIPINRLYAARRSPWGSGQPLSVKRIFLPANGGFSENEA